MVEYGGIYDCEKLTWKRVIDVILSFTCSSSSRLPFPLERRFVRHFNVLMAPEKDENEIQTIFKVINN